MSQFIASSIAEDVHIIRDMKVQLYEKKAPIIITTLRTIPLFFIGLLIAVIITQYVRKNEINGEYQNGLDVTHYGYWRHDLLAEINLKFRYLQLMARNMITYDGTTEALYEANLKSQLSTLVATLDYVQFQVIEGRIQLNKTSGNLVIGNYQFVDMLEDGYIYRRTDVYNKFLWRSLTRMQQLINSPFDTYILPLTDKSSLLSVFYYVQTNGLWSLRKGSEDIAGSFVTFYMDRPAVFRRFFIITTIIALGLIVTFQLFVIYQILSILNARIKALALFGYIPLPEVYTLIEQCQIYSEQFLTDILSELDSSLSNAAESFPLLTKSENSFEMSKYTDLSFGSPSMNDQLASIPQTEQQAPHFIPRRLLSQNSQEGGLLSPKSDAPLMSPLASPASLLSPTSQGSFLLRRKSSDKLNTPNAFVSPKFLSTARRSFTKENKENHTGGSLLSGAVSLTSLLRQGEFQKRAKSSKTVKILETDINETKQSLPLMTRTLTTHGAEDRSLITKENTPKKKKDSSKKKKKKDKKNKKEEEEEEEDEEEIYYEYFNEKRKVLGNPQKHKRGLAIFKILATTSIFIAAFIAKLFLEFHSIDVFQNSILHLQLLSQRSPNLRYVNTFCLEELSAADPSAVYPSYPASTAQKRNLRTNYTNQVFENQQGLMGTLKDKLPSYFDGYINTVSTYMTENTCEILYGNNPTLQSKCETIGDREFKANLIQREIRVVEDINDLLVRFYGTDPAIDTQTQIDYINGEEFKIINEVLETVTPAIRDLVDRFVVTFEDYGKNLQTIDLIVFGGFLILFFVMFTIVWMWYLRHLSWQIEVMKGMLNMMSVNILMNNKSLRQAFTYSSVINIIK